MRGDLFNKQTHVLSCDIGNCWNHDARSRVEVRVDVREDHCVATLHLGHRRLGDNSTGDLDGSIDFRRALVVRRVPGGNLWRVSLAAHE